MKNLSEYFSEKPELLAVAVICVAAVVILSLILALIKIKTDKKRERAVIISEKALLDGETEGADFSVKKTGSGYRAELKTKNGTVCETKDYSSKAGAISALKSLKNNIDAGNVAITVNGDGSFSVRIYSSTGVLFESDPYPDESSAMRALFVIEKAAEIAKKDQ